MVTTAFQEGQSGHAPIFSVNGSGLGLTSGQEFFVSADGQWWAICSIYHAKIHESVVTRHMSKWPKCVGGRSSARTISRTNGGKEGKGKGEGTKERGKWKGEDGRKRDSRGLKEGK